MSDACFARLLAHDATNGVYSIGSFLNVVLGRVVVRQLVDDVEALENA